ncbi:hypothetical protein OsJ_28456 [Oryza sativa Japonica Group]|uniref:Uncharacterized protein n=1 Tax=Oryza sativa subsp. japonica TaxID=39947 RepID=A3BW99_ORYSJ|nr:hypothetical protein OsJ_28456 [Oryza sativa Japonica Group]
MESLVIDFLCAYGLDATVELGVLLTVGLERSKHSFLWGVHTPVASDTDSMMSREARRGGVAPKGVHGQDSGEERHTGVAVVGAIRGGSTHPMISVFVTHCIWMAYISGGEKGLAAHALPCSVIFIKSLKIFTSYKLQKKEEGEKLKKITMFATNQKLSALKDPSFYTYAEEHLF